MNKLVQEIKSIRTRLDTLRKHGLKETLTRSIVIDPLLIALGWDLRDPDEVEMEYPTVDGKSVDYALKLNRRAVLLVEAKPLDDPLTDVKAITQVVNYANNDGIAWCVLSNGLTWKVYRSVEKCPAPEKLMFEVLLDPHGASEVSVDELAKCLWRISREAMVHGTLDALGEQVFTDGRVRKALDEVFRNAPRALVKVVRDAVGDSELSNNRVRESITRVWTQKPINEAIPSSCAPGVEPSGRRTDGSSMQPNERRKFRKSRATKTTYDETLHTAGKSQEVIELYRAVEQFCHSLVSRKVERRVQAKSIAFVVDGCSFCSVHLQQAGLRIWLKLKYGRLENPPDFARDVSGVGHWGAGDLELRVTRREQLESTFSLIKQSLVGL